MVVQISSRLLNGLGVASFSDEQDSPGIGVSGQRDIAVPPGARCLIDGKRRHIRVVRHATGDLHVLL